MSMNELNERRIIDLGIRLLFLALFLYAAIAIVAPLAGIVLWAVILAVAVYPVFDWLARVLGGRRVWAAKEHVDSRSSEWVAPGYAALACTRREDRTGAVCVLHFDDSLLLVHAGQV